MGAGYGSTDARKANARGIAKCLVHLRMKLDCVPLVSGDVVRSKIFAEKITCLWIYFRHCKNSAKEQMIHAMSNLMMLVFLFLLQLFGSHETQRCTFI